MRSTDDERIAAETIEFLKPHVASNDELTRRHGKFISMEIRKWSGKSVVRRRPSRIEMANINNPAMLVIQCLARFDKFSTIIEVRVFDGAALNISMEPTNEDATKEKLAGYDLVQMDGDELWFVRPSSHPFGYAAGRSWVEIEVSHPDFKP